MKKCIVFSFTVLAAVLSVAGCRDIFINEEDDRSIETWNRDPTTITFQDREQFTVGISTQPNAPVSDWIIGVPGNAASNPKEHSVGEVTFYLTCLLRIGGVEIPYSFPAGKGVVISNVSAAANTVIPIPRLEDTHTEEELYVPITQGVYVKIQNSSPFVVSLAQGNSIIRTTDDLSTISPDNAGVYKLSAGLASQYSLKADITTIVSFPAELVQFTGAELYSFQCPVAGGIKLTSDPKVISPAAALGSY